MTCWIWITKFVRCMILYCIRCVCVLNTSIREQLLSYFVRYAAIMKRDVFLWGRDESDDRMGEEIEKSRGKKGWIEQNSAKSLPAVTMKTNFHLDFAQHGFFCVLLHIIRPHTTRFFFDVANVTCDIIRTVRINNKQRTNRQHTNNLTTTTATTTATKNRSRWKCVICLILKW